jgi:hypothetical protein
VSQPIGTTAERSDVHVAIIVTIVDGLLFFNSSRRRRAFGLRLGKMLLFALFEYGHPTFGHLNAPLTNICCAKNVFTLQNPRI